MCLQPSQVTHLLLPFLLALLVSYDIVQVQPRPRGCKDSTTQAHCEQTPGFISGHILLTEGIVPTACTPSLVGAAQPGRMPRPLLPMHCKGQSPKPIHEGTSGTVAAPRSQPSRQVLRGVSVQLRAGKTTFLPPSFPPHPAPW